MRSETCTLDASQRITPQGSPYQDTGYLYDRSGNIWKQLERVKDSGYSPTRDALDRLYTYDALNRLLSATGRETAYVTTPGSTERLWDASPWDGDVTLKSLSARPSVSSMSRSWAPAYLVHDPRLCRGH